MHNQAFWTHKYERGNTGWDLGEASPPLMKLAQKYPKDSRILLPGAGNAHEYVALRKLGFTSVYVLDLSDRPLAALREKFPDDLEYFIHGDFFNHEGAYDLILEQTFFCALHPDLRATYSGKMKTLLADENARLAGVLFNRTFGIEGPPYGGSEEEYRLLFTPHLNLLHMEPCYNSIEPRMGSELFFIAKRGTLPLNL